MSFFPSEGWSLHIFFPFICQNNCLLVERGIANKSGSTGDWLPVCAVKKEHIQSLALLLVVLKENQH